jgi:Phage Tail Collar Domain
VISFGLPLPPGLPAAPLGLPAGCVIAFAGEVSAIGAPPAPYVLDLERWGWMVCDGRQLPISQYPELFAVLGFRYVHEGEPTDLPTDPTAAAAAKFRVPDYRGTFLRGANGYGGGSGGVDPDPDRRTSPSGAASAEVGSIQQHALQNHEHFYPQVSSATGGSGPAVAGMPTPGNQGGETVGDPQPQDNASELFLSKHETRPKNVYVYYLVRTTNGLAGLGAAQLPALGPRLPGGSR